MRVILILGLTCWMGVNSAFCQNGNAYAARIKEAYRLYQDKQYLESGKKYAAAFAAEGNKGMLEDWYDAACSWALAGVPDSSFRILFMIANKGKYADEERLIQDTDLDPLHGDPRWNEMLTIVRLNRENAEAHYNKKLIAILDTVYADDQKYRLQLVAVAEKYGWESKEVDSTEKALKVIMREADSLNTVKVTAILEEYGWLGPDIVGEQGNSALWAVIQHSDLKTQEKYLPVMREAVRNGLARADQLALLEDRVALKEGRKQIYGSQLGMDPVTKITYVCPLEDPDHVDERRARVGLPPMQEYLEPVHLKWDPEQYKKDLPAIEAVDNGRWLDK